MTRSDLLSITAAITLSLAALSLAACANPPEGQTGGVLPPQQMQCDADASTAAIGRPHSDAVVEQARIAAGAKTTRVLHPDQPAAMDFRHDRLNVRLDDAGVMKSLDCG